MVRLILDMDVSSALDTEVTMEKKVKLLRVENQPAPQTRKTIQRFCHLEKME